MRSSAAPPPAVRYAALPDPFPMWKGGQLARAQIAYECWGELNAERSNAILLFTGLSPTAHAASSAGNRDPGWWENMIGPGRAIDTDRFFVMCVNSLGSCFGSTGPSSINPATGKSYRLEFPELSVEDIARAGFEAARSLGIRQLDTVMGPSLGGMVVVAFAAVAPGGSRRLLSISGSSAALPFAIALRSLQRELSAADEQMTAEPRQKCLKTPVPAAEAAIGRLGEVLGLVTRWKMGRKFTLSPASSRHPKFHRGFWGVTSCLRLLLSKLIMSRSKSKQGPRFAFFKHWPW